MGNRKLQRKAVGIFGGGADPWILNPPPLSVMPELRAVQSLPALIPSDKSAPTQTVGQTSAVASLLWRRCFWWTWGCPGLRYKFVDPPPPQVERADAIADSLFVQPRVEDMLSW